jgi:hypothetical protein
VRLSLEKGSLECIRHWSLGHISHWNFWSTFNDCSTPTASERLVASCCMNILGPVPALLPTGFCLPPDRFGAPWRESGPGRVGGGGGGSTGKKYLRQFGIKIGKVVNLIMELIRTTWKFCYSTSMFARFNYNIQKKIWLFIIKFCSEKPIFS